MAARVIVRQFYVRPGSTLIECAVETIEGGEQWRNVPPEEIGSVDLADARLIGEWRGYRVYQQFVRSTPPQSVCPCENPYCEGTHDANATVATNSRVIMGRRDL